MWQLWLYILLLPSPILATEFVRECTPEPVFGDEVCVYQANTQAESSILLVHGINGNSRFDWEFQLSALAQRHHVVAVDLPGFGASSKGRGSYSPDNYARLLAFLAPRYLHTKYSLVGHSMGAVVILRYAARYAGPDLERLVIIDSAGILHGLALSKALAGAYASRFGSSEFAAFVGRMTGKLLGAVEDLPEVIRKAVSEAWVGGDSVHTAAISAATADMSLDLEQVDQPVLILWGEGDAVAPLRTGYVLRAILSDAELVILPGAGHMLMRDRPDRVNELILGFLTTGAFPDNADVPQNDEALGGASAVARCQNESGREYRGSYHRIELRHCDRVVIDGASIGSIYAFESRVQILNSKVAGADVALEAIGSEVEVTASRISGGRGVVASRSRLDLAGVDLEGTEAAFVADGVADVIFSVSKVRSPYTDAYLHGFRALHNQSI